MSEARMALEPCGDGALAWLSDDPVPYPDLAGQISDQEIGRLETIGLSGEWL